MLPLVALAIFLGLASAILPYGFLIAVAMVPLLAAIAVFNTEFVLVVVIAAIVGVIPAFLLPSLPLGGVVVRAGELLLFMLAVLTFLKPAYRQTPVAAILRPIQSPLVILAVMYIVSITYSVVIKRDAFGLAEARNVVGWLCLPAAVFAFHWRFRRLDLYLHIFSVLVALLLVAQTLFGVQLIFSQRGAEALSQEFNDVIRSSAGPAIFLIGYTLYYALGRAATADWKAFWLVLVIFLTAALVVSFTRGTWAAAFAGLCMFFWVTRVHRLMAGTLVVLAILGIVLSAGLMVVKPKLADVVVERILSIGAEGGQGTSVGARFDENEQAFKAILANPLVGVGVGGAYKQYTSTRGRAVEEGEFTYIHNSYLGLAVKLGLLALLVPFWLYRNIWREWNRHRRSLSANVRGLRLNLAAAVSAITMFMVNGLSQPEWLRLGGLVTLSVLVALVLSASWLLDKEESSSVCVK
jgi:O-antigen ligase